MVLVDEKLEVLRELLEEECREDARIEPLLQFEVLVVKVAMILVSFRALSPFECHRRLFFEAAR